jgi:hypothetical protein
MALLLKETRTFRVDSEHEALEMIKDYREKAKSEPYEVKKASYVKKEKKQKGEIIDEWCVVDISLVYE